MSHGLTVTDLLLLQAAAAAEFSVRPSRGYEDGKPEGWPIVLYRGRPVVAGDQGRLFALERAGYLAWAGDGPIEVAEDAQAVLR